MARPYPERELTQEEVERFALLDGNEAKGCSDAAIAYVDHITSRDLALTQLRQHNKSPRPLHGPDAHRQ